MSDTGEIIQRAFELDLVVPAFNVPYLPMMEPVIQAIRDLDSFGLIETARLEWIKFEAGGPAEILNEYCRWQEPRNVRLHLDHVPVIDEDNLKVDYLQILQEAIDLGYQSVMVDGSRLSLSDNIASTRQAVEIAHRAGVPCEAELGAVLGHASGPPPSYDELYESGRGFTQPDEALRFVQETGCDWLSVAIGSIHGAISGMWKDQKKVEARLDLEHLAKLQGATGIPLVLHGGSSVSQKHLLAAIKQGIAKVNIGTEIRQAYEVAIKEEESVSRGQQAVYERTCWLIRDYFGVEGTSSRLLGAG